MGGLLNLNQNLFSSVCVEVFEAVGALMDQDFAIRTLLEEIEDERNFFGTFRNVSGPGAIAMAEKVRAQHSD